MTGPGRAGRRTASSSQRPPGEKSPSYVAEARFLAERLRELHDAGVDRGDMVVLLRAFTHVDAFEDALVRAGLAPYVVGGRGYWSQQQVEDTLRLLGVVANPLDDELLFGALASPACGVSADALWLFRDAARHPDGGRATSGRRIEEGEWPRRHSGGRRRAPGALPECARRVARGGAAATPGLAHRPCDHGLRL